MTLLEIEEETFNISSLTYRPDLGYEMHVEGKTYVVTDIFYSVGPKGLNCHVKMTQKMLSAGMVKFYAILGSAYCLGVALMIILNT